jgi:CBS domain containing-hemolysin-like protein
MAEKGVTRLPVVERRDGTLVGMVALSDLLTARTRILEAEQRRERTLGPGLRLRVFRRPDSPKAARA